MGILNITPAERAGAHLLIQLYGPPRSGKTYTALRIARGMVGPRGAIGLLDTESGRARLYSDKVPGGFVVGELTPPYTPRRYLEAIEEFLRYGIDILVVDSFSHCWEGPGGVLEMADQAEEHGKTGLLKWLRPKRDYKKLVSFLLSTRLHMILCSRAKQPIVEAIVDGEKALVTQPSEPIQDKRLKYEMTIVVPMTLDGGYETDPSRLKVPGDLAHLFQGEQLDETTGARIAEWVKGGKPVDHALELLRRRAFDAAGRGSVVFSKWWNSTSVRGRRKSLRPDLDNLVSIARAADDEIARDREADAAARQKAVDAALLDDPFGKNPIRGNGSLDPRMAAATSGKNRQPAYEGAA
ncbi:MAG: AAA family ATPase [Alphaproteobacteria bacterium]|nr:AAA family ATPase [Alphaproteobacteria bacterium]